MLHPTFRPRPATVFILASLAVPFLMPGTAHAEPAEKADSSTHAMLDWIDNVFRTVDSKNGYSLVIPEVFKVDDSLENSILNAFSESEGDDDNFLENIGVGTEALPKDTTPSEMLQLEWNGLRDLKHYHEVAHGNWDQGPDPGIWIEYTCDVVDTGTSHDLTYMVANPDQVYILTCSALDSSFDNWEESFHQTADSFRFEPADSAKRTVDHKHGFSLVFPPELRPYDDPPGEADMGAISVANDTDDKYYENIIVMTEDIPSDMSNDEYFAATKRNMDTLDGYREIGSGDWKLDDHPGMWLECATSLKDGGETHDLIYVIIADGTAYVISGTAMDSTFEAWRPVFEETARSFELE